MNNYNEIISQTNSQMMKTKN